MIKISPSILSADFAQLGEEIKKLDAAGADYIHCDVMDLHYVPNLTFGFQTLKAIRKYTQKPFDVHLMISNPYPFLKLFKEAGADILTVHYETLTHHEKVLSEIKALGMKAGIALNPGTHPLNIEYLLHKLDLVLIMTVNPGFGGQNFIESQLDKIKYVKNMISNFPIELEVDGGVNNITAPKLKAAGANVLVAGNYIFNSESYASKIQELKLV